MQVAFAPPGGAQDEHAGHGGHAAPVTPAKPKFGLPAQAIIVYVNPYDARVLGSLAQQRAFRQLGEKAAFRACCRMIAGLDDRTGRQLADGDAGDGRGAVVAARRQIGLPKRGARGRNGWRQWHAFLGWRSVSSACDPVRRGWTWSQRRAAHPRAARRQRPGAAARAARLAFTGGVRRSTAGCVAGSAQPCAAIAVQLTAPASQDDVWHATMADRSQPTLRFDLQFDAYSGKPLYYAGWEAQTASARHGHRHSVNRGEFGWWTGLLLMLWRQRAVLAGVWAG